MLLYQILAIFSAACGSVAGFLHMKELETGFSAEGFALPGNRWRLALVILTAAVMAILLFFSIFMVIPNSKNTATVFCNITVPQKVFYFLSACCFTVGGVFTFLHAIGEKQLPWIVCGVLLIASGVCLVIIGVVMFRGAFPKECSVFALLPVFWACFHVVLNFRSDMQNPVIFTYLWDVLAMVSLVLLTFYFSGVLFNRLSSSRLFFACGSTLFFQMLNLVSGLPKAIEALQAETEFTVKCDAFLSPVLAVAAILLAIFCLLVLLHRRKQTGQ